MQLKPTGQGNRPLLMAVLLSAVLVVLGILNTDFEVVSEDLRQAFLAEDVGLSRVRTWSETAGKLPDIARGMLAGYPDRTAVETLFIDINPEDYRVLLHDRDIALANRILAEPEEVKAKLRFRGRQYRADVRLKGDLIDHWLSKTRMSLRVEMKNDASILGFSRFSIQKPASRQHPLDQVFQALVRRAGNLATAHQYVDVVFNGEHWGRMNMEESMSVEFLEKQERKESLIVKFSDDQRGVYAASLEQAGIPPYDDYRLSDEILYASMYEPGRYAADPQFRKWLSYIIRERTNYIDTTLYDIDAYSRALFMASYWNDGHPLFYLNARHYFNPYTLQLEPVTTDAFIPFSIRAYGGMFPRDQFNPMTTNHIYNYIMSTDQFMENRDRNFDVAFQAVKFAAQEFETYHAYFPLDDLDPRYLQALEDNIYVLNDPETRDSVFVSRGVAVDGVTAPPSPEQAALMPHHVSVRHFEDGTFHIFNLLPDVITVKSLMLDNERVIAVDRAIPAYEEGYYAPLVLQTTITGLRDATLAVETQYAGHTRVTPVDLTLYAQGLENPLLDTQYRPAYLSGSGTEGWRIPAGDWLVEQPLVLDGDLHIAAGTSLRFAAGTYLVVRGALQAVGTADAKITLSPAGDSWKGVYVYNAAGRSELRQVVMHGYDALQDGLLSLTGGLTFYRADVTIEEVELYGVVGEDALNIVDSSFTINGLSVHDTRSDGLDSDFSAGTISGVRFENINGDAIDFSGSLVDISDYTANYIYDKAVSVGEASIVTVQDARISNVGAGIVSKDGSDTRGSNISVSGYGLAAAMAYEKKPFYGQPSLVLDGFTYDGDTPAIRQTGATFMLEGRAVPEQDVDVDYLYESTVMKK